jgi:hypothetical protein
MLTVVLDLRSRVNLNLFTTAPLYYTLSTQVTSNSWKIIIFIALLNKFTPLPSVRWVPQPPSFSL